MVPRAGETFADRAHELLRLLAPSPERWEFSFRQALICVLTALVVLTYQTPDAALTVYVVFFLNKPDRAMSLILNIVFLVVITITIGLALVTTMLVIDAPVWRVASIATISFALLFLTSASKLRPLGTTIALITGYALDLLGSIQIPEIATRGLLYAWLFVGIPAGVSITVNLAIAPSPRSLAQRALARRLRLSALMLRDAGAEMRGEFSALLQEGPAEIPEWLKLAAMEKTSPAQDIAALRQAAESTTAILLLIDLCTRDPACALPTPVRESIARMLDEMVAVLRAGGYPVRISFDDVCGGATLPPLAAAVLADLRAVIERFAEPPPEPAAKPEAKAPGGFFLPDAFTNPGHVHFALKTTAAAMFCYCFYMLLDWPGIHTCFLTCYIVALTTAAEAVEKLVLRVLGCLIGAAAGIAAIVFVMPWLTSIGSLVTVVFVAAFLSAWVAAGTPRISYVGFQIAFAFFLSVIQGPAPAFDMTAVRDRVIGILIGNFVSFVVFTGIWPVSVAGRIDPAIRALLLRLSAMASDAAASARQAIAGEALAANAAIGQDLELVRYEPGWLRPQPGWLPQRVRAMRAVTGLTGVLLLSSDRAPALALDFGRRLRTMADAFAAPSVPVAEPAQARPVAGEDIGLRALFDGYLRALEALARHASA
jgi:multidrug resistance protein MdtO